MSTQQSILLKSLSLDVSPLGNSNLTVRPLSYKFISLIILIVLVGSGLQGYANGTVDTIFVAFFFLFSGWVAVLFMSTGRVSEIKVFLLTYSLCLFVGGLAQCYSLAIFNNPQSTTDAFTFLQHISAEPPFRTMENMPFINSPLAVLIWQQLYKLTWWLGIDFGPYTAVMFNALVMGGTGSITVATARELFGDDDWRLQRVGILFAFCGLFIMFGALLLRDCFTTFLSALVLWVLVRCLVRQSLWRFFQATTIISISAYAMLYLRVPAVLLFGVYVVLACILWYFEKGVNTARLFVAIFTLCLLLFSSTYLLNYFQEAQNAQERAINSYSSFSLTNPASSSLGVRLIINQPLPVRLVLGSGTLMVSPIPLWTNFNLRSFDYHWIKGYNGLYQVFVIPLVLVGFRMCFQMFRREPERAVPILFLGVYLIINLASVVATSLEQRHFAQFMPAFIILAALPDVRDKRIGKELRTITIGWYVVIILVHLAWMIATLDK